ncbi:MAG: cache domain-containing protein [Rubrivivax sp.]|nr:cache domain-containing protein [Rubrivivax sp.]
MNAFGLGGRTFRRLSIRNKLLAMVLLPLWVVLPLLGLLLLWWGNEAIDRMLITKVRADLAVAQGYFERVLGEVGSSTAAVADSHALQLALGAPADQIVPLLQRFKEREGLDFINLRAPDGSLRYSDSGAVATLDRRSPAFTTAADGDDRTSVEVLAPEQIALLAPTLQARVAVPLLDTRNAGPTDRTREERAMVLLSTRAVRAIDGRLLGHVQGGVLLNRNLPFIDHINAIVYPEGSLPFGSRGTATLFLDDVRISTNVRLFGGEKDERAIGTRVSRTVREAVLGRGNTWLDRAFVVEDWYVSAYQPLLDGSGQRVGMLYVGYLEKPFTLLKYATLASIGVIFFAVMILAAVVSLRWARTIFKPLEQMEATMRSVEGGALGARVGHVDSEDEIGRLAGHLDHLLDVIDDKTQALQRWNAELDAKVAERTAQLADAQAHLVRSEKLAAVGQLTASIAHEVNNPIAVIQGNLDLVRELLPAEASQRIAPELKLIDQQIERMRLIVTQLLQFARPNEYAGYVENVAPERVIDDCLVLVGHLLAKTSIEVRRDSRSAGSVAINRQELQQVLVNLLVNAIDVMPAGGTLALGTRDLVDDSVEIVVSDTGPGLAAGLLAELFQPFVTRKKAGTGLGLWISRSLVERYGGSITAANRSDGVSGAVFSVRLRRDASA